MSTQSVVETVTALVKPILDDHHFYLTDVEFVKEGGGWYLRVYIDKPGGITLDEALSEQLDAINPDPIPQQYFLEVSSPGAERPLKRETDYEQAIGDYIHVSLFKKLDGKKVFEGTLKDLKPDQLTLTVKDKSRKFDQVIDRKLIASARLAIEF